MNAAFYFNVAGIEFIAAMLAAAAFFHLPATVLRQGFWAAANFLVLWLVLPNPASRIALAIFLGSGYVGAEALRAQAELQQLADYLKREKINFAIALLPVASWHQRLPYPAEYKAMIEEFCEKNAVQLYDRSTIAGDDDFIDYIHLNQKGLPKSDAAMMEILAQVPPAHRCLAGELAWSFARHNDPTQ